MSAQIKDGGPVDVLKDAVARLPKSKWDDGQRAIAAVSELIEAAAEMNCLAKGPKGGVSVSDKRAVIARMDAALANVGSTK